MIFDLVQTTISYRLSANIDSKLSLGAICNQCFIFVFAVYRFLVHFPVLLKRDANY